MRTLTRLFAGAAFAALLALTPRAVNAQGVTTAGIQGRVTDASGAPVAGAEVSGVHTPSGTSYRTTSRTGGAYTLNNVRVGGPYTVTVTGPGGAAKRITGISTELLQSAQVNVQLAAAAPAPVGTVIAPEAGGPDRVIVEAAAIDDEVFSPTRQGAATNIGRDKIDTLPTIARSLQDFTRLTPQANGGSIAGGNNRFNNISIDGSTINDSFGLEASGAITGRAQPISLDVIDQVRVSISPYDVRQSNFTGGSIDAVTKSGTNTFHGSVYGFYRDASLVGTDTYTPTGLKHSKLTGFEEYTYGFTLGGPILKDKLFFFVGFESKRRKEPQLGSIGSTNTGTGFFGNPLAITNTNAVIATATTQYGYNPGTTGTALDKVNDDKVFVRMDWNITKDQKLTLRYNYVNSEFTEGISRSSTSYSLTGLQYSRPYESNSFVAQLLSTWTSNFTTEARVAYNRLRTERTVSIRFPNVSVFVAGGQSINFGVERSSQENALNQDIIESVFNATYYLGTHTLTAGLNVDNFSFKNLFIQDAFGTYGFNSPAQFAAGTPQRYRYSYLLPGGNELVDWSYYNLGLYLQDEWKATPKLNITAGIRVDLPIFPESPRSNAQFAADFPGRDTGKLPENKYSFSPRLGFNWNIFGNAQGTSENAPVADAKGVIPPARSKSFWDQFATVLRGGIGLFNGKTPSVWISNQYSNTGLDFARLDRSFGSTTFGTPVTSPAGFFQPDPTRQPQAGQSGLSPLATTAIALTSPNFRFPQILRGNIAVDQKLPWGFVLTAEALLSKDVEAVTYRNLNLGTVQRFLVPDGRPFFSSTAVNPRYTSVIEIGNTSKGHSYIGTIALERPLQKDGWSFKAAYTRSNIRTAGDYTSSVALSNWQNNVVSGDPNASIVNRSVFEIKDRVLVALNYTLNVDKPWQTTFGFLLDSHSGQPYTFVYSNDVNGDGISGNDAIYVPRDRNDVVVTAANGSGLTNQQATDAFWANVEGNKFLRNNKGRILPINGGTNPWINRLDFRFAQRIPTPQYGKFKGQLEVYFDVLNVLNLFGKNFGGIKTYGGQLFSNVFFTNATIVNGKYNYSYNPASTALATPTGTSSSFSSASAGQANIDARWQLQGGLRYSF